jgi:hypothetical protein
VVERLDPRSVVAVGNRLEIDVPQPRQAVPLVDEIDEAAAEAAHRRDVEFARPDGLLERAVEQPDRAVDRGARVVDPQRHRANRHPVDDLEGVREALAFAIDDDVDAALPPARDRLRTVDAGLRETHAVQEPLERCGRRLVHREFDEFDAAAGRARRRVGQARHRDAGVPLERVQHLDQRTLPVDRHAARGAGAEAIVEDLQRQEPVEARRLQRVHERVDRQLALPGEAAVVAAPRQEVHLEPRRVGHLHEEDAVLRHGADGREVGAPRENVEAVEHEPHRRMVGAPDDLPSVAIVVDVPAPRQRLERDAQAPPRRTLAEFAEIGRGAVDAPQRVGRDVGADHQQVAAEFGHHVELALGPREDALALGLGHAFEIAEGLEGGDAQPEFGDHPAHVARRAVEREKVVLEDLDRAEARRGDGGELLVERAAERHRRDRRLHGASPSG